MDNVKHTDKEVTFMEKLRVHMDDLTCQLLDFSMQWWGCGQDVGVGGQDVGRG